MYMHVSLCDGAWAGRSTAQGEDRCAAGTDPVCLAALGRKRQAHFGVVGSTDALRRLADAELNSDRT